MDKASYNRQYYQKNRERLLAKSKAYGRSHPENEKARKNIPERRLYTKAWQRDHPGRMKELKRKNHEENRERDAKSFHEWHIKNVVRVWAKSSIRSHQRAGYEVAVTTAQLIELAKNTTNCFYCGEEMDWKYKGGNQQFRRAPTVDRFQNGRILDIGNIKIICRLCNTTKGPRTHEEFINYCKKIAGSASTS